MSEQQELSPTEMELRLIGKELKKQGFVPEGEEEFAIRAIACDCIRKLKVLQAEKIKLPHEVDELKKAQTRITELSQWHTDATSLLQSMNDSDDWHGGGANDVQHFLTYGRLP